MTQTTEWKFWGAGYALLSVIALLALTACGNKKSGSPGGANLGNAPGGIYLPPPSPNYGNPSGALCPNSIELETPSMAGAVRVSGSDLRNELLRRGHSYRITQTAFHREVRRGGLGGQAVQSLFLRAPLDLNAHSVNSMVANVRPDCVQNDASWKVSANALDHVDPYRGMCRNRLSLEISGNGMVTERARLRSVSLTRPASCFAEARENGVPARAFYILPDGAVEVRIRKTGRPEAHTGDVTITTTALRYEAR